MTSKPAPQSPLSRRSALKSAAAAGVGATWVTADLGRRIDAADQASGLKGRIHHSVCRWCYSKIELDALCKASKEMGIQSIDLLGLDEIPVAQKHGLTCAMVSGIPGGIGKGLNRRENHDSILQWFESAAPKVAAAGCVNVICFSGNRAGMSNEEGLEHCAVGLKRLLPIAEKHKLVLVMELLNSKVDHADYMCDHTAWGVELCKRTGSDRFKLLYDIYHMQIMEGDVIRTLRASAPYIAHYHTGGVPGRNEIDESQEIYYPAVMEAIVATGFKGFVAQEFIPKRPDALASLRQGVHICDV
ncbi:MAG: TIM barrel protein [Verrucomicrobiales bacterium]|nr:TIM barrel protein [Verrucomicrobiales bacterium]